MDSHFQHVLKHPIPSHPPSLSTSILFLFHFHPLSLTLIYSKVLSKQTASSIIILHNQQHGTQSLESPFTSYTHDKEITYSHKSQVFNFKDFFFLSTFYYLKLHDKIFATEIILLNSFLTQRKITINFHFEHFE